MWSIKTVTYNISSNDLSEDCSGVKSGFYCFIEMFVGELERSKWFNRH